MKGQLTTNVPPVRISKAVLSGQNVKVEYVDGQYRVVTEEIAEQLEQSLPGPVSFNQLNVDLDIYLPVLGAFEYVSQTKTTISGVYAPNVWDTVYSLWFEGSTTNAGLFRVDYDGSLVWAKQYMVEGNQTGASNVVWDYWGKRIFLNTQRLTGTNPTPLIIIDPDTGNVRDAIHVNGAGQTPKIMNDGTFVTHGSNTLVEFNGLAVEKAWKIYFPGCNTALYSISPLWSLSNGRLFVGKQACVNPVVINYVIYQDGLIANVGDDGVNWATAFNTSTSTTGRQCYITGADYDGQYVYAIGHDGDLVKVNASDGSVIWTKTISTTLGTSYYAGSVSVLPDGTVLTVFHETGAPATGLGQGFSVVALDSDGNLKWAKSYNPVLGGKNLQLEIVAASVIGAQYILLGAYLLDVNAGEYHATIIRTDTSGNTNATQIAVTDVTDKFTVTDANPTIKDLTDKLTVEDITDSVNIEDVKSLVTQEDMKDKMRVVRL